MGLERRFRRSWAVFSATLAIVALGAVTSSFNAVAAETPDAEGAGGFKHVMSVGQAGDGPGQFQYVEDMALTSDGRLLVTDAGHGHVQAFDKTTGAYLARFGGRGERPEHLVKPEGIAVSPGGHIFIADYETGLIRKYAADFSLISMFSEHGSGPGQNFKAEFMSIADGRLYVPEAGNHRVDVFDLDGNFLFMFGGQGGEPGQLNNPESAKVGPDQRLYVSDLKNHRIQIFDLKGQLIEVWGRIGREAGGLRGPTGVGFDGVGNVYVGEMGNHRVQVFNNKGESIAMWGREGRDVGEFSSIHGVLVDPETGWVYVADTGNHRIQVFARGDEAEKPNAKPAPAR